MSSVVESNLIQVKIVERSRSTFILFEDFSSVVESAWPGARLSTRQFKACGCAVENSFRPNAQYVQKVFVRHSHHLSETSRIFDTELCEDIFKITCLLSSFHGFIQALVFPLFIFVSSSSKTVTKIRAATALRFLFASFMLIREQQEK